MLGMSGTGGMPGMSGTGGMPGMPGTGEFAIFFVFAGFAWLFSRFKGIEYHFFSALNTLRPYGVVCQSVTH